MRMLRSGLAGTTMAIALAAAILRSGCAAAIVGGGLAAGVSGYYYVRGELKRTYAATFDDTYSAVRVAIQTLELKVDRFTRDRLSAEIYCVRANGQEVAVFVTSLRAKSTDVGVRMGAFGNRVASERFHATVLDELRGHGAIAEDARPPATP